MNLKEEVKALIQGDVFDDDKTLEEYSEDKSIFKIKPKLVVFPRDDNDIVKLVEFVRQKRSRGDYLTLTARSAGTDMSGGPLTESILIVLTKYLNQIKEINDDSAIVQPGVYYHDFEKETLKKNLIMPSYPASKNLCALGGMIANDSGGELSLQYGKTHNFVLGLKIVLADGLEYYFEKLNKEQLEKKLVQNNFEGEIYRQTYELIKNNFDLIEKSKPLVHKNSSGYNIWDVYKPARPDQPESCFDLTKLFVGSQGTLGLITEIKVGLVKRKKFEKLYIVLTQANDLNRLPDFVNDVLKIEPDSFEVTDKNTFKLFLKYAREMASLLGGRGLLSTARMFLPEALMIAKRLSLPDLIILVDFWSDDENKLEIKIKTLEKIVNNYGFGGRLCRNQTEIEKYWRLRRDTFKLLREKIKNKLAAPFIDDLIVRPENLPEFLPRLYKILDQAKIFYTISGHIGEGNLHIIPLVDMTSETERKKIFEVTDKVYDLVIQYHGSLSAEHNDGLIRGPYLKQEFGDQVFDLFVQIKKIFDPDNIFNPHKKTNADKNYSFSWIRKS
ncbi:MAG: FAD-binding oxidoreductase [Patescibacteria group bacterium]|nr:FAD-binding oxidoreductase [Patescibacteria group bacterium]